MEKSEKVIEDDIPCREWLKEVDKEEYFDCFMVNCPSPDKDRNKGILCRKRLCQLRLQDFPKLNIKSFDDAKILHEHVKHSLSYSFSSPVRKSEVQVRRKKLGLEEEVAETSLPRIKTPVAQKRQLGSSESAPFIGPFMTENPFSSENSSNGSSSKEKDKIKKHDSVNTSSRRRRSFDNQVWQSINQLRTSAATAAAAADSLREGVLPEVEKKKSSTRQRRRTIDHDEVKKEGRGQQYGNMAQAYDVMQNRMLALQLEELHYVRGLVGCEYALIRFVNWQNQQLLLFHNGKWFHHEMAGLTG
jgi:hypothetical protein